MRGLFFGPSHAPKALVRQLQPLTCAAMRTYGRPLRPATRSCSASERRSMANSWCLAMGPLAQDRARSVRYDNIKYTKNVSFNRNRFLQNGTDAFFSIPLQNDSD